MSIVLGLFSFLLLGAQDVTAPVEAPGWEYSTELFHLDRRGSVRDYTVRVFKVRTADTSKPQIMFSCNEESGLVVRLQTKPLDAHSDEELQARARVKYRTVTRTVTFGGDRQERVVFAHVRKDDAYSSARHGTSSKFYNHVVRGTSFELEGAVFDPPPMDEDFRLFARSCYVTNGSSKNGN